MQIDDFDEFFAAVNNGNEPFAWQRRLCRLVGETGAWPDAISAPTGAGKSNVVDVHVFLNALYASGSGVRVPRRLSVVVGRRALVDQHMERACLIQRLLESAKDGLLLDIRAALAGLAQRVDMREETKQRCDEPLVLASLRGGVRPNREWLRDPRSCAVIAATPDMWGSRLLFRGYGASRYSWPREAGLLAYDNVMVLDEAHLNRQLLQTARVVAGAVSKYASTIGVPGLQVVSTTATQDAHGGVVVGVEDEDLRDERSRLLQRLTRPKPAVLHRSDAWPKSKATTTYIDELCDLAESAYAHRPSGSETVGVVVNHVDTAVRVAQALEKRLESGCPQKVVAWVGRMRPLDLAARRREHPGLFTTEGDPTVRFLVATQTVEVGIDLDLGALVTELASGSALTQRAGRVNRLGLRDSGPVTVVAPRGEPETRLPYEGDDLRAALCWLEHRVTDANGLSAQAVRIDPPPGQRSRRPVIAELQPADINFLAETSEARFVEPELEFWLRDDLDQESEPIGIVLRDTLPADDLSAVELLRATNVDPAEVFPTTLGQARKIVDELFASQRSRVLDPIGRLFILRHGDIRAVRTVDPDSADAEDFDPRPRPGDTLVLDADHHLSWHGVIVDPQTASDERIQCLWTTPERSLPLPEDKSRSGPGMVILAESPGSVGSALLDEIQDQQAEAASEAASALLGREVEVVIWPSAESGDDIEWVVLRPLEALVADEETRQESSVGCGSVTLDRHSANVARLARRMATELGLAGPLPVQLELAGRHHDDGKADPRFQVLLGGNGTEVRAKSGLRSRQAVWASYRRSGLPPGWRHEQLSVAMASRAIDDGVVLRLIGTSHGRGRSMFPHGLGLLPAPDPRVGLLFGNGAGWSEILEATEATYGVWGCAFLEAVLRSADCLVSEDGS